MFNAEAVKNAASNESGAMNGFLGVGMMNMAAGSGMMGPVTNNAFSIQGASSTTNTPVDPYAKEQENNGITICSNCGAKVTGKFCSECGTLVNATKKCSNCGMDVNGKFCANCGTKVE